MSKFIYKVVLFAVLFLVLDKFFLLVEARLPGLEYDQRLEQLINKEIKAEVIILGSSRGARGILANELEATIGHSCYNLSYPGSDITFHEFLFEKCMEQGEAKPKVIVLTLDDPGMFYDYKTINFRYDKLYPLTTYPTIRETLVAKGKKTAVVVDWVVAYRIRELFPSRLRPQVKTANETLGSHGSMPLDFSTEEFKTKEHKPNLTVTYDPKLDKKEKINALLAMLDMAKEYQVKLLLVHPPNFYEPTMAFRDTVKALVGGKAAIYCYNQSNLSYKDPNYFYDESHLKLNGAKVFTQELAEEINAILTE